MEKEEVGYVVNFVTDLGNGRQISLTGNLAKHASKEDMDKEFDKVRSAMDRQQAKSASRGVSDEIAQLSLRYKNAVDDLVNLDEKNKNRTLSANERSQREAAIAHVDKMKKDLDFKRGILNQLVDESK